MLVLHLLMGRNYRLLTERNTKEKLLATYTWLCDLQARYRRSHGRRWREALLGEVMCSYPDVEEAKDLAHWVVGLTRKTAVNLDARPEAFPELLRETIAYCQQLLSSAPWDRDAEDQAWLMLMAGAATLNIRGSQKSRVGKALERVFMKAALTLLGLREGRDFWVNVPSDREVERETDVEVTTRRGRIRMDVALIAQGNPEVIADKVNRVGRNGIVVFDRIGARAGVVRESAEGRGVKLIQIRHSRPLTELHRHLQPLMLIPLKEPPDSEPATDEALRALPDEIFDVLRR